jgi:hypothetical protein
VSVHALPKILEYHGDMLADGVRVGAFARALEARVRPGAIVVDLGGGTGVLSALACRAGAARVYMIEAGPIIGFARELLAGSGLADRVVAIHGASTETTLPEPVDLVVTETIGVAGFDEGILGSVADARRRFARAGVAPGIVPRRLALWAAPLSDGELHEHLVGRWGAPLSHAPGFDTRPVRARAAQHLYIQRVEPERLVAPGREVVAVDLETLERPFVEGEVRFELPRAVTVHGFALWFVAELAPGVVLSNVPGAGPVAEVGRHWSHGFLPLPDAVAAHAGDSVELAVQVNDGGLWRWRGRVGDVAFDQCTAFGAPLARP